MKLKFPKNLQSSYYFIYKVLINLHSEFSSLANASQLQLDNKREHAPRLMNDSISNFYSKRNNSLLKLLFNHLCKRGMRGEPHSGVLREGESDPQLGQGEQQKSYGGIQGQKLIREGFNNKKKTWELSLTGGGRVNPLPYLLLYLFFGKFMQHFG